jgi:UDP-N-acetylglucosamine--N-acetylmuramyl-(pentapeptide) pyrophosphoryl-undecaprenol N-acetylglucosamine transferase
MKILFCGGGTLGPVTPLLAVLRRIREKDPTTTFAWAGTTTGPEGALVEAESVPFHAVPVARWPRHPSVEWLKFPFRYFAASRMAQELLATEKPDLVVTAGGYSGVPIIRLATKQGIPSALHQLDFEAGLSNYLVAKICSSVTTSFYYEVSPFGSAVASIQVETPCRFMETDLPTTEEAKNFFGIDLGRPVVFVMGGGTGALPINRALADILDELLLHADVIHATGIGRAVSRVERNGYQAFELMNEDQIRYAYAAADVVVSRAGLGSISELASLKKAAIVIPIPHSHQEANARAVEKGIVWLHQTKTGFSDALRNAVLDLLGDEARCHVLGFELHQLLPTDDGSALAKRWMKLL